VQDKVNPVDGTNETALYEHPKSGDDMRGPKGSQPDRDTQSEEYGPGQSIQCALDEHPRTLRPRQEAGHRPRGDIDVRPVFVFNAA